MKNPTRILLVRRGCPHCRQILPEINRINMKMELHKRIKIVDAFEYEELGMNFPPVLKKFSRNKLFDGFPLLYLDGIIIEPFPTREQARVFLNEYFKNEIAF